MDRACFGPFHSVSAIMIKLDVGFAKNNIYPTIIICRYIYGKNYSVQNYMLKESRSHIIICAPWNTVINDRNVRRATSLTWINLNTRLFYFIFYISINKLLLLDTYTFYSLRVCVCARALSIGKFLSFTKCISR